MSDTLGSIARFPFSPDPVIAVPTREQILAIVEEHGAQAPAVLQDIERRRCEMRAKRKEDPFTHGYIPPVWKWALEILQRVTLLVLFGANRSSKSTFAIWHAIRHMVEDPNAKVLFLHEDERQSIDTHQETVFNYLPAAWKPTEKSSRKRSQSTKLGYTRGTGFADNTFILPNGAKGTFGFYTQDEARWEGGEFTLIVADENLPLSLLQTLLVRLVTLGGKMIWPFTPIKGITPTIAYVSSGANTVKSERAPRLPESHRVDKMQDWPAGHLPRHQKTLRKDTEILYFWPDDNPFLKREAFDQMLEGADTQKIERRAYGFARNVVGKTFPLFGAHNIADEAATARFLAQPVTRRMVLDPAPARNAFIQWWATDQHGRHLCYREWPDFQTFGEWATASVNANRWNGELGPAQESLGYSIVRYKQAILEAEGWRWNPTSRKYEAAKGKTPEEIEERLIDPRAGKAEQVAEDDGGTSLMDLFADEQTGNNGEVTGPALLFVPAPGLHEDEGIEAINNLLGWEPSQDLVPLLNEPRLYITERCANTAHALAHYRLGKPKTDQACKDPVDDTRYFVTSDPTFYDPAAKRGRGIVGIG
jgi:hypothetical protein